MRRTTFIFGSIIVLALAVFPILGFAATGFTNYKIITSIPGTDVVAGQSINGITIASYIAIIYQGALALVGFVAFVMIVYWGVMYTVSGGNTSKTTEARNGITQALLGLVLLLAGFVILQFVNPALVNVEQINSDLNALPTPTIQDPGAAKIIDSQIKSITNIPSGCVGPVGAVNTGQYQWYCGSGPKAGIRCIQQKTCDLSCAPNGGNSCSQSI